MEEPLARPANPLAPSEQEGNAVHPTILAFALSLAAVARVAADPVPAEVVLADDFESGELRWKAQGEGLRLSIVELAPVGRALCLDNAAGRGPGFAYVAAG